MTAPSGLAPPPWLDTAMARARQTPIEAVAAAAGVAMGLVVLMNSWAPVAAIVGILVVGAAVLRPTWLVPLLFASILLESVGETGVAIAGVPLTASKVVALAMIFVWAVHAGYTRRPIAAPIPMSVGLVAVVSTMVLSAYRAEMLIPEDGVFPIVGVITLSLIAHLIPAMVTPADLRWLLRIMASITLLVLLYQFLAGERVESAFAERYSGAFNDPNMWCTTLALIVPLALATMTRERNRLWVPALIGLTALYPVNVFQSLSRAGLITLAFLSPFIGWLVWPRRVWFMVAALSLPVVVPLAVDLEALTERYNTMIDPSMTEMDGSIQARAHLAETGWHLLQEHWLAGVGAGMFRMEAVYRTKGAAYMIAHNTYLTIAVEQGLLGILSHMLLFGQIGLHMFRTIQAAKTPTLKRLAWGYTMSVLGFALMSATLNMITFAMAYFVLAIGVVIGRATELPPETLTRYQLD